MKSIFIIFSLLFLTNSQAQVWIDNNATWHYDWTCIGIGGTHEISYTQDTLINGVSYQKIEGTKTSFYIQQDGSYQQGNTNTYLAGITYVNGDTVFYQNNNEFFPMLNFGAQIGDSWVIATENPEPSNMCGDTSKVIVTNIGTLTINAIDYRTITIESVANSPYYLQGTYVERFGQVSGSIGFPLFPILYICNPNDIVDWCFVSFNCFEDDSFSLYNPSGNSCTFSLGVKDNRKKTLSIYPNPVNTELNIELDLKETTNCLIYNSFGEIVMSKKIENNFTKLDVSNLPKGLYFIKIGQVFETFIKV